MAVKKPAYISKGERPIYQRSIVKAVRRDVSYMDKALRIAKAWRDGKNPNLTIANPEPDSGDHIKNAQRSPTAKLAANTPVKEGGWGQPKDNFFKMRTLTNEQIDQIMARERWAKIKEEKKAAEKAAELAKMKQVA